MQQLNKIFIAFICILLLAGSYFGFRLGVMAKHAQALKNQNSALFSQKNALEEDVKKEEFAIKQLRDELEQLKDAQRLKQQLVIAQERLGVLTADFEKVKNEKTALEQTSLTLNSRLNNLTKEFGKTLEELKEAKQSLIRTESDKTILSLRSKIEETALILKKKEENLNLLNKEIKEARQESGSSLKKTTALEKDKQKLQSEVEDLKKQLNRKLIPISELEKTVSGLKKELNFKEKDKQRLQAELDKVSAERMASDKKLTQVQEQLIALEGQSKNLDKYESLKTDTAQLQSRLAQSEKELDLRNKTIAELKDELDKVKKQLSQSEAEKIVLAQDVVKLKGNKDDLDSSLNARKTELDALGKKISAMQQDKEQRIKELEDEKARVQAQLSQAQEELKKRDMERSGGGGSEVKFSQGETQDKLNKAYALYDTAKAQVVKFSELLINKEVEIEKSRQKISILEAEYAGLKEKAVVLEKELSETKIQFAQMSKAGASITDLKAEWENKNKEIAQLQENVYSLKKQILEKEEQLKKLSGQNAEYIALKVGLEEKLNYQNKSYDEINTLYTTLKGQIVQVTDLLAQRDTNIKNKDQELSDVKAQLSRFQTDLDSAKKELDTIKERQHKTLDDLSRAAKLNSALQENLIELYKNADGTSSDKNKAEQLKQEVELLLRK